jgi:hypothetical protein
MQIKTTHDLMNVLSKTLSELQGNRIKHPQAKLILNTSREMTSLARLELQYKKFSWLTNKAQKSLMKANGAVALLPGK